MLLCKRWNKSPSSGSGGHGLVSGKLYSSLQTYESGSLTVLITGLLVDIKSEAKKPDNFWNN